MEAPLPTLHPPSTPQPKRPNHQAGVSRVALRVVDLKPFHRRLLEAGIEFEGDVADIDIVGAKCFILFRDPDGTLLELIEFSKVRPIGCLEGFCCRSCFASCIRRGKI